MVNIKELRTMLFEVIRDIDLNDTQMVATRNIFKWNHYK